MPVEEGLVVYFLSPHRFDREDVRPCARARRERGPERIPCTSAPQQRRSLHVPDVRGSHTQGARNAGILVEATERLMKERDNLRAPLGMFRHRREELKLHHEARKLQTGRRPLNHLADFPVFDHDGLPGLRRNAHRGESEVQLRVHLPSADDQAGAARYRARGPAERER